MELPTEGERRAQALHEQRQYDDEDHDADSCWCCCTDCNFDWATITGQPREICTCPNCRHPTARHGTGYVEIESRKVWVMACLDCPRNACLINPVG